MVSWKHALRSRASPNLTPGRGLNRAMLGHPLRETAFLSTLKYYEHDSNYCEKTARNARDRLLAKAGSMVGRQPSLERMFTSLVSTISILLSLIRNPRRF